MCGGRNPLAVALVEVLEEVSAGLVPSMGGLKQNEMLRENYQNILFAPLSNTVPPDNHSVKNCVTNKNYCSFAGIFYSTKQFKSSNP